MAAQDDRDAIRNELAQERADGVRASRIKAARRLVKEQQPRIAQQRGGDPEPLSHARRVTGDAVPCAGRQADALERPVDVRPVGVVEPREQLEVRAAGQVRVERRFLDKPGETAERVVRPVDATMSEQLDRPRVRRDQSEQRPQQRRLSGAVPPEQAPQLTRADLQIDAVEGDGRPVALREAADAESGRSGFGDRHGRRRVTPSRRPPGRVQR